MLPVKVNLNPTKKPSENQVFLLVNGKSYNDFETRPPLALSTVTL